VAGLVEGDAPSTKAASAHLAGIVSGQHVLVVVERHDEVTRKSLRNIASVHLIVPGQLNTYDVLVSDDVVFTEGALAEFLAGPPKGKAASAIAREEELEKLADAVTTLAKAPQRVVARPATSTQATTQETPVSETEGNTTAAGDDVSDEEMAAEVAGQTDSDITAEEAFKSEAGGAGSDTEAAKDPGGVGE
jgi:large subunit ribosomal protein L4